jgi:uncharacterized protein
MLTVKTSIGPSKINGIGLFAEEKIPKGAIVWKFDNRFDVLFNPADVEKMSEREQEIIQRYGYLSIKLKMYVCPLDNSRFQNHSSKTNNIIQSEIPGEIELCDIANKDIEIGEELLMNYREFDAKDATSGEDYLND